MSGKSQTSTAQQSYELKKAHASVIGFYQKSALTHERVDGFVAEVNLGKRGVSNEKEKENVFAKVWLHTAFAMHAGACSVSFDWVACPDVACPLGRVPRRCSASLLAQRGKRTIRKPPSRPFLMQTSTLRALTDWNWRRMISAGATTKSASCSVCQH
jgi:hypothetical protein